MVFAKGIVHPRLGVDLDVAFDGIPPRVGRFFSDQTVDFDVGLPAIIATVAPRNRGKTQQDDRNHQRVDNKFPTGQHHNKLLSTRRQGGILRPVARRSGVKICGIS